ncbi:hypothetical protein [Bradyrhizobium sp. PRIMUS42]|uniref:hypothetical protein n=1 Tax=Bradyrhizobium sp. PRIMUS42 TaxID=2908926 RepID=UPI001FF4DDB2|nr:hypothetical protein [Bradyrhizobium sp. PRIMUS42]MCJ9731295.1 hypothetical protein [Bradyrhizobium sp. PRIMUS42]
MTPKHKQQRDRSEQPLAAPPVDATMLDPAFDDLNDADAEWCRWKWPERADEH